MQTSFSRNCHGGSRANGFSSARDNTRRALRSSSEKRRAGAHTDPRANRPKIRWAEEQRRAAHRARTAEMSAVSGLALAHGWIAAHGAPGAEMSNALVLTVASTACGSPDAGRKMQPVRRSEEHTSELQSLRHLVCRL